MEANRMAAEPNEKPLQYPLTWKLIPQPSGYQIVSAFEGRVFSSLDEISLALPFGAYTTFRTYQHSRALRLEDHFNRLNESAQRALTPIRINPDEVRDALRSVLQRLEDRDYRFRLTLDLELAPGEIYISIEPLLPPPLEAYQLGVKVISKLMQRENPKAKLTGFIKDAYQIRTILPEGVNEALMVRGDGLILEGLSSNFFGIRDGHVYTSEQGVLAGITRSVVLEICKEVSIPIHTEGVYLSNAYDLDEAFISSASRGILPVIQIDLVKIGSGRPGPITHELMELFQGRVELDTQEI